MNTKKTIRGLALAGAVALTGCSDEPAPLAPAGDADPATRGGAGTGIVTVVHGVPGLVVDVYVNGAKTLPAFEPGTVTDPLELPEDDYDIVIVPEGGDPAVDGVITGSAFLPAGANASIVAHLTEDGSPTLSVFVNDVSDTFWIGSRVVVRHVAAAPTVDVRLFRKILPWWPVRTIRDLSNPNEVQTGVFPGRLRAKLYPAGSYESVFTSPYLPFRPNTSTIVYAIGSIADGTFGLLTQQIQLNGRSWWYRNGTAISDDLTLEEYDKIAIEQGLDEAPETELVR